MGRIHWKSDVVAQTLAPSWLENTEFICLHALPGPRMLFATLAYLDMDHSPCPLTVEHARRTLHAFFPDWLDRVRAMHSVWLHIHGLPSSRTDEKERWLQFKQLLTGQSLPTSILYPPTEFDALE